MLDERLLKIADYFSPSDLIELLEINTVDLILALEEFDQFILDDDTVNELEEIMGVRV